MSVGLLSVGNMLIKWEVREQSNIIMILNHKHDMHFFFQQKQCHFLYAILQSWLIHILGSGVQWGIWLFMFCTNFKTLCVLTTSLNETSVIGQALGRSSLCQVSIFFI